MHIQHAFYIPTFPILGDFAMLLNAGMSAKQALIYNSVSCVLCFIGMACGISMGNVVVSRQWIFAAIAGMFLYIALVDMVSTFMTD